MYRKETPYRHGKKGDLLFWDQDKNLIVGVFKNKNSRGKKYVIVSMTCLKGDYVQRIDLSVPEFLRLKGILNKIEIQNTKEEEPTKNGET